MRVFPPMNAPARRRIVILLTAAMTFAGADWLVRRNERSLDAYYIDRFRRKRPVLEGLAPRPDIILLGSSRTDYGLVPEEFMRATGRSAFNFGIPSTKVIEWRIMAREAFRNWRPALVVLGVNASDVRADYLPVPAARDLFTPADFIGYCMSDGW